MRFGLVAIVASIGGVGIRFETKCRTIAKMIFDTQMGGTSKVMNKMVKSAKALLVWIMQMAA